MLITHNPNNSYYSDESMLKENIGAGTVVEIKESAVIDATY